MAQRLHYRYCRSERAASRKSLFHSGAQTWPAIGGDRCCSAIADPGRKGFVAKLRPLAIDKMPLHAPPPKNTRGKPLVLSRLRWVKPKLVAEVTYLTWADDGLLRHVVYQGLREDKPAQDVRRAG